MRRKLWSYVVCTFLLLSMFAAMNIVLDVPKNVEPTTPGWMNEVRLANTSEGYWMKDVAVWNNFVHVVWSNQSYENGGIFYKRSTNNGLAWSNDTLLFSSLYGQYCVNIAVYENHVHIVWSDGGVSIRYINSSDNGENWSNIMSWNWTTYPPSWRDAMEWPDVAVNDSHVYIVCVSWYTCDVILKRSSDNGATWTDWIFVYDGGFPYPIPTIHITDNMIHITGDQHDTPLYEGWVDHYFSDDGGDTWYNNVCNPIILYYSDEMIITHAVATTYEDKYCLYYSLMYMDGITHNGTYFKYCYDSDPDTWYGPYQVLTNGEGHFDVDEYHIIWGEKDENDHRQLHSNMTGQITDYPSNCTTPLIRIYGDTTHVVWEDDRHGNNELYYTNTGLWADLAISGSDIEFDPPSPVEEGTNVFINATIHNYGNSTQNIEVKFYNGNPDVNGDLIPDLIAQEIGNVTINIGTYSYTNALIIWAPQSTGIYYIYVWADPNNLEPEYNESNNLAFNSLEVIASPQPSPPKELIARLSYPNPSDVELEWNASVDDGSGEDDVAGYTVYKSSNGINGSYEFASWIAANGSLSYNWTDTNAGDGDWNDYFYIVRANDTLDIEEQNINKVGKFVNYLVEDWNLISVPLIQANTSIEYVLQTIEANYSAIYSYHAGKSRPWLHSRKAKPQFFNDVFEINHIKGYYIDMLNSDHLVVAGRVPIVTQISLKAGWNLVDYPCLINKTRDDALSSIDGKYNIVEYYDTDIDKEVRLGPNDYMEPGLGYWVHVTSKCVWEVSP